MSDLNRILKRAESFRKEPEIALVKSFSELSTLLEGVIKAIEASKTEPISISNPEAIKSEPIDLNPLKTAIESVIPAIKAIPTLDLSGVTKLLEKIGNKEDKEVDLKELDNISSILKAVNDSVNAIKIPEQKEGEKTIPDLKEIQKILNVLNENLIAIEIPEFDYEKLERIIKKIKIVGGGGGPSTVTIGNTSSSPVPVLITVPTNANHGQLDVGTTEVAVPTVAGSDTTCIKALAANAQKIYVGKTGVTSTNGFELGASEALELDTTDAVPWFVIAASGTQRICYIIVS